MNNTLWLCIVFVSVLTVSLAQAGEKKAVQHNTVDRYLQQHRQAGDKPNRLIEQSSPYLLQHAYNPVQWYAWGEEAFEQARQQDKPIFLSIGYSTCYWCHVMARESFDNPDIAAYLNQHFISIKVDREERPDIDSVYMMATELINGHGGWPMTVFLDNDLRPFHAGTYYPPEDRNGHTGLKTLLQRVVRLWKHDRQRIQQAADSITLKIQVMADEAQPGASLDKNIKAKAIRQIAMRFDDEYGGFSAAPKFPRPGIFRFLLREAEQDKTALDMMVTTLDAMMRGGIYDRVGGGFHRYSVDEQWHLPHFEKMLYTQALMVMAYNDLYRITGQEKYLQTVKQTLAFVEREMRDDNGGFYSALDAESLLPATGKKTEGAYYLWSQDALSKLLNKNEWQVVRDVYAIEKAGNMPHASAEALQGLNILAIDEDAPELNSRQQQWLQSARQKLFRARQARPRPHLDDKIIAAWNGMMIRALVDTAVLTGERQYTQLAQQAAELIASRFVDSGRQRMYRRMRNDEVGVNAGLDDYAWNVNALLALYRLDRQDKWLELARQLLQWQQQQFYDETHGGYFEAASDSSLLFRSRSIYDGALPAANAVVIDNLQQFADITGEKKWRQLAQQAIDAFAASVNASPSSAGWLLSVLP